MSTQRPPTYTVRILARRELSVYPKVGEEVKQMAITYVAEGLPPSTVIIEKEKYTFELERKLIRADLELRLKERADATRIEYMV